MLLYCTRNKNPFKWVASCFTVENNDCVYDPECVLLLKYLYENMSSHTCSGNIKIEKGQIKQGPIIYNGNDNTKMFYVCQLYQNIIKKQKML